MPNVRESFLRHKLQKWVNCFHIYLPKVHKLFLQHCLETLPHIRQITILGTAAYFVSCVTSITEMSPVTRMSKPKRERSRGDLRAQRVVCGESTPGPYHHHQHQEASAISYHVAYLTMPNTNTLTNMCPCYSARRNMLDPQTSLDSIFLPIPS